MNIYDEYDERGLQKLVGKTIKKIQMNEEYLVFTDSDDKAYAYTVEGDCCSSSYFYDFYGVSSLLRGKPILKVETVELEPNEGSTNNNDVVQVYGFRFITYGGFYGEVSSVFSFRNDSNGYYGGTMYTTDDYPSDVPEITKDTLL